MELSSQIEILMTHQQSIENCNQNQMIQPRLLMSQETQAYLNKENLTNHAFIRCFRQYSQRNKDFVDNFLQNNLSTTNCLNSYRLDTLKKCWKSIFHFNIIKKELYEISVDTLASIMNHQIEKIMTNMSQKDRQYYRLILKQTQYIIENLKKTDKIQINLSIQQLVKIEVLSLFFKVNYQITKKYKICFDKHTISLKTLNKLFNMNSAILKIYDEKFEQFMQYIHYDYQENFKFIVNFTLFLQFRKKIASVIKCKQINGPQQALKKKFIKQQPDVLVNRQQQHFYFYKFCQLIFLTTGQHFENKSPSRKYQIIDQLRIMQRIDSNQLQKRQFLRIKHWHSMNFTSLRYVLSAVLQNNVKAAKKYEYELNIKEVLLKCQWIFMNVQKNHYQVFQKLVNWHYKQVRMVDGQTYTCDFLVKLAKQRLLLASSIMRVQIQFFKSQGQIKKIYINRFEYSFKSFIKEQKEAQFQESNDLNCTLILGTDQSNIQFYIVRPQILNYKQYSSQLKKILQKLRKNDKKRYAAYLYQDQLQIQPEIQQYWTMFGNFKKEFDSFLFITNLVERFHLHFILDNRVKYFLKIIQDKLTKENFFENLQRIINGVVKSLRKVCSLVKIKFDKQ